LPHLKVSEHFELSRAMKRVVANLEGSLAAHSRAVFVIWANPLHTSLFRGSPAFRSAGTSPAHAFFESVAR
jgi:hypothetical protein